MHPQAVRNKGQWQCPFWSKRGKNSTCSGSAKHSQPTPHPPEKKAHFWLPLYGAFFAWRHIRHVGVPNQSCGSGTFFLSKHFLLFQWFCKAAGRALTFFGSPTGDERGGHFIRSSEPRDDLAVCREKAATSFLCYFKTLTIGPVPEIESSIYRFAVKLSTHWTNPANGPSGGRFCSVALRKLAELYLLGWL